MAYFPYLTGEGITRYRLVYGDGTTTGSPDIGAVSDVDTQTAIANLSAKFPTLGQKAQSGSVSVVPATNSSIITTSFAYNNFVSMGVSAGGNIKATSGTIYSLTATNANANTRFIQIFNKATAPTTGDTPILCYPVYGSYGTLMIDDNLWGKVGIGFSTGISWGFSTTYLTYTAGTGSDVVFDARWI